MPILSSAVEAVWHLPAVLVIIPGNLELLTPSHFGHLYRYLAIDKA